MATFFDRGPRADGSPATGVLGAVPADPRSTGLTYEPFYGLREKPFSLTSDPRFFYPSRSHAVAFEDLLHAVKRRESLTAVTGDIGTGKSTLCRAVLANLDHKTFSAFVSDPLASREDLLKVVLTSFGAASSDDFGTGRLRDASRTDLTCVLREFLDSLAPSQAFAVLFVDEAQHLSAPLLDELRILSDGDGAIQVVLVGQLELSERLRLPAMRQLEQRMSARCHLQPLDLASVGGYISHRLQRAGGSADRISFSSPAVESIYELSGGIPRVVNKLCDRALHAGYARKAAVIDRDMIEGVHTEDTATAPASLTGAGTVSAPAAASASVIAGVPSVSTPVPAIASTSTPPVSAPAAAPDASDPVEAWLNSIEDKPIARAMLEPVSRDREPARQSAGERRSGSQRTLRIRVGYARNMPRRSRPTYVPRKWSRRLEWLAFSLILLLLGLMVGPSAWNAGTDTLIYIQERLGPASPPSTPLRLPPGIPAGETAHAVHP